MVTKGDDQASAFMALMLGLKPRPTSMRLPSMKLTKAQVRKMATPKMPKNRKAA